MVHLPDPRDIDRFLCRGREKFDLGFACDCPKGWCALMNNPEGIQNPRVSAVLKSAGLADREVGLVAVTCGVSSAKHKFPCSYSATSQFYIHWNLGSAGIVIEEKRVRGRRNRDRNDSEKTCETQGLAGPDDSEQVGTNQVSLNYWRQSKCMASVLTLYFH